MAKIQGDEFDVDSIIKRAAERGETITPLQVNLQRRFDPDPTRADPIDDIIDRAVKFRDENARKRGPTGQELRDRIQAGKLGARIQAKKQLDSQIRELGYSPQQKKRFAALEESRAKSFEKLADGSFSVQDVQRVEALIDTDQDLIIPTMQTREPTPQERFKATWVTMPDGSMASYNAEKQTFTPLNVGTEISFKDYNTGIADLTESMTKYDDVTGKAIPPDPLAVEWVYGERLLRYERFQGHVRGTGGAAAGPQPSGDRPTSLRQRDAMAERERANEEVIGRIMAASGRPREQVVADLEKAKAGKPLTRPSAKRGRKAGAFEALSPEKQEKVRSFFRDREAKRQAPSTSTFTGSGFAQPERKIFAPQSEEQAIAEFNKDASLRKKIGEFAGKQFKDITSDEWTAMYEEYKSKSAGLRILSKEGFKRLIKANPDRIQEFLIESPE